MNNEKRNKRINLSFSYEQFKNIEERANLSGIKIIDFATKAVLGKRVFGTNNKKFQQQILEDYRKQISFFKLLLDECDLTDECKEIIKTTLSDFIFKIERIEKIRRETDGDWHDIKKN